MNTIVRRVVQASVAVTGSIALLASVAPAATAATARNGICEDYEFCLYHGADFTGSVSDFGHGSIPNYGSSQPGCYEYKGPGTGQGECVKNNARSARNRTHIHVVKIFYNSNYGGINVTFNPGGEANLGRLTEENASHLFELVS
ncbi:peptidase inhibitor family I36 protein [Actinokineospora spheciospongiae]|uniref:peptidase inhibitor family I36 protein n=1 Tax=Actinokineospora spheciospongiae TaxID=909613 RepID=UPI000D70C1AF|nr:peptidase inhibitor family I36 protein [Actinokineospora spheciospongiae]PWW63519.1 peptidase inhibitor family I36 [Actinokineospora spheciospongiae]